MRPEQPIRAETGPHYPCLDWRTGDKGGHRDARNVSPGPRPHQIDGGLSRVISLVPKLTPCE